MAEANDEIRVRAYAIWEQEGYPQGRSLDHWLRAEAEIAANAQSVKAKPAIAPERAKAA